MYRTLITEDRLNELVRLAKKRPLFSKIYELGVYKGGSLKYMADHLPAVSFVGIDTFKGLPEEHWNSEEIHKPGDFNDNSLREVSLYLDGYPIRLYEGLFPNVMNIVERVEDLDNIGMVHVDFDFYEGAKAAIDYFYPKLKKNGIMVFDDYEWPNCPGVKKALDESGIKYQKTNAAYQAYLIKQ